MKYNDTKQELFNYLNPEDNNQISLINKKELN